MTNEERELIQGFIQRTGGAASGGFGGSVPPTGAPPLPPVDREADALIADLFARYPEARYRITQMAFMQEHALAAAQNQINQLQWQLQNMRQQQSPAPQASPWGNAPTAAPTAQSSGLFGGLFGGRSQPPPQQPQYAPQPQYAQPAPQYAPGYQPGMFQPRGSGFLGSALTTAAGVAGGMVAGNALMNLFSGNHGGGFGGGFGGGGFAGPSAVEYVPVADSPWSPAPGSDAYESGGALKDQSGWGQSQASGQDQGWQDAPSTDTASSDGGGWADAGGNDGPDNS